LAYSATLNLKIRENQYNTCTPRHLRSGQVCVPVQVSMAESL